MAKAARNTSGQRLGQKIVLINDPAGEKTNLSNRTLTNTLSLANAFDDYFRVYSKISEGDCGKIFAQVIARIVILANCGIWNSIWYRIKN
jgi:hypothetical protein